MARRVDDAMRADRPEKRVIREAWIDIVEAEQSYVGDSPLYLTLPGSVGHEIRLLIERGVLRTFDNGAIHNDDIPKVVAIESSPHAEAGLRRQFPGLNVRRVSVANLLSGYDRTVYPEGKHRRFATAKIINLDLNGSLSTDDVSGQTVWRELELVHKIAALQRRNPKQWFLFLTVNADINWSESARALAVKHLRRNLVRSPYFRDRCRKVLGRELYCSIQSGHSELNEYCSNKRQRFLMAWLPKRIASDVCHLGWTMKTLSNTKYGGGASAAAMLTWILRFDWPVGPDKEPEDNYGDAVDSSLDNCFRLSEVGDRVRIVT